MHLRALYGAIAMNRLQVSAFADLKSCRVAHPLPAILVEFSETAYQLLPGWYLQMIMIRISILVTLNLKQTCPHDRNQPCRRHRPPARR